MTTNIIALMAEALATTDTLSTRMIKTLAGNCNLSKTETHSYATELLAAKAQAECDMACYF